MRLYTDGIYYRTLGTLTLLVAIMANGCSLFDTRDPENPVTAGSTFEPPVTPSIVLRNIESALLTANASDYRRCFSDTSKGLPSFVFYPSTQGLSAAPVAFADWGVDDEERYIKNIFSEIPRTEVASVIFTPSEVTAVPIADSVQYTAHYEVRFPHTRSGAEREAEGQLQFTMRRSEQNEWYISAWRDIVLENRTSWSLIKARFIGS